jgi:hypothetical protein
MAVDFGDKRFRSDFKPERDRVLSAIRDCEALDADLTGTIASLKLNMARTRGAASLVVRMTEQVIANRNLRLSLIKELRALKRDVIEREIKLAEKTDDAQKGAGASGITAELLSRLQAIILVPGGGAMTLEPPNYAAPAEKNEELVEELDLPDELRIGDVVCDPNGNLWVIGDEGAEETGLRAAEVYPEPSDQQVPYAILEDGRTVLVVDIG